MSPLGTLNTRSTRYARHDTAIYHGSLVFFDRKHLQMAEYLIEPFGVLG